MKGCPGPPNVARALRLAVARTHVSASARCSFTAAAIGLNWCTPRGGTIGVEPVGGGVGATLPPPDFCIDPITGITYTYTFAAYATDHLGTVRAIYTTNPDGTTGLQTFDYEPFGVEITSPNDIACGNTHRFTGHERDAETGNDYMHFRYFAAGMGRFMKPDSTFGNAAANPQGWNLYTYVKGNPVNFNDPTGHMPVRPGGTAPSEESLVPLQGTLMMAKSLRGATAAARGEAAQKVATKETGKMGNKSAGTTSEVQTTPEPQTPVTPPSSQPADGTSISPMPPCNQLEHTPIGTPLSPEVVGATRTSGTVQLSYPIPAEKAQLTPIPGKGGVSGGESGAIVRSRNPSQVEGTQVLQETATLFTLPGQPCGNITYYAVPQDRVISGDSKIEWTTPFSRGGTRLSTPGESLDRDQIWIYLGAYPYAQ